MGREVEDMDRGWDEVLEGPFRRGRGRWNGERADGERKSVTRGIGGMAMQGVVEWTKNEAKVRRYAEMTGMPFKRCGRLLLIIM